MPISLKKLIEIKLWDNYGTMRGHGLQEENVFVYKVYRLKKPRAHMGL
jgi:hypothetical protein